MSSRGNINIAKAQDERNEPWPKTTNPLTSRIQKATENAPDQSTSAADAQVMPADFAISLAAKGGADNLLRKVKVVSGVPTEGKR